MSSTLLSSVDVAIDAFRQGKMLIVVDDEDRENEGDLVLAADFVTPEAINFMVTHARGLVCLAMRGALLDRLQIPMMVPQAQNRSGFGTGFTLSVEAAHGVTTGISAEDRAHTISTLINPDSTAADIAMPGHVFPLRARDAGVLERRGQTEASVDLSALAGLTPAAVICEIMRHDGSMMRLDDLGKFAAEHDLHIISVEQLAQFRLSSKQGDMASAVDAAVDAADDAQEQHITGNADNQQAAGNSYNQMPAVMADVRHAAANPPGQQASTVPQDQRAPAKTNGHQHASHANRPASTSNAFERQSNARSLIIEIGRSVLPTAHGDFDIVVFRDHQGLEHSALIKGKPEQEQAPLVRLHSECLTGDAFGSLRCDCGPQLQSAMKRINKAGVGAVMYLRQEGRGIGLGNKIRAYALQDKGRDTVDANQELGFPADARTYDVAAAMLNELGISSVRLLSNNPAKQSALESFGISVDERVPLVVDTQSHNESYLRTKAERMGHNYFRDEA